MHSEFRAKIDIRWAYPKVENWARQGLLESFSLLPLSATDSEHVACNLEFSRGKIESAGGVPSKLAFLSGMQMLGSQLLAEPLMGHAA